MKKRKQPYQIDYLSPKRQRKQALKLMYGVTTGRQLKKLYHQLNNTGRFTPA
jgi:ribosomal protein S4